MNKKTFPKIVLGLSILVLIFEILYLDFDNLAQSLTENIWTLAVPVLIILSMWVALRQNEKQVEKEVSTEN